MEEYIIKAIEKLKPTPLEWIELCRDSCIPRKGRHATPRAHMKWLKRKAKRHAGYSRKYQDFHHGLVRKASPRGPL
jgi:hypothetical protein